MDQIKISMAAARVNAGFTQREIAAKMQVSTNTIVNWEKGKVVPKPAQFKMYCDLCGMPVEYIFLPAV